MWRFEGGIMLCHSRILGRNNAVEIDQATEVSEKLRGIVLELTETTSLEFIGVDSGLNCIVLA
jgi:hypothetical protein